jgi:hypothetical protein
VQTIGAYDLLQSQQPQTLAHALADSPVGLLGWLNQIYRGGYHPDFVLTTCCPTGTPTPSPRRCGCITRSPALAAGRRRTSPVAVSQFANDYRSIRSLVERDHPGLHTFTEHAHGNHFAARSSPATVVEDLQTFFTAITPGH